MASGVGQGSDRSLFVLAPKKRVPAMHHVWGVGAPEIFPASHPDRCHNAVRAKSAGGSTGESGSGGRDGSTCCHQDEHIRGPSGGWWPGGFPLPSHRTRGRRLLV